MGHTFHPSTTQLVLLISLGHGIMILHLSLSFFLWPHMWPHMWHMEVPAWGVELELQQRPTPQSWQHQFWVASAIYTAACSNTRSLTHWARPRMKTTSSWTLCGVLNPLNHSGNAHLFLINCYGINISWLRRSFFFFFPHSQTNLLNENPWF